MKTNIIILISIVLFFSTSSIPKNKVNEAPSIVMWKSLNKWSKHYNVPKRIAFGISFTETSYRGPFDWEWKYNRTSSAGALGPMQIMPIAALDVLGYNVNSNRLMNDIDLNVKISMMFLNKLHKRYKSWDKALAYYNTGMPDPEINDYVSKVNNYDYNWKKLNY